jgi:hypothetical protein
LNQGQTEILIKLENKTNREWKKQSPIFLLFW